MKKIIFSLIFILLFALSPVYSYALSANEPVDFKAAEAVPSGAELPEFYTPVENSAGLYIFMTADGAVHKRIYGSAGGETGWFVAHGVDNEVYSLSPDADLDADRELYYASPWVYTGTTTGTTHAGLISPERGVRAVDSIFGVEPGFLFRLLGLSTVFLCLVILIAAAGRRSKSRH